MLRAVDGDAVLLVVNGSLDPVDVVLAPLAPDGDETTWELAWNSTWEHPGEVSAAALNGGLHQDAGTRAAQEPLSLRVYLA
jgi:glycogen operon protein